MPKPFRLIALFAVIALIQGLAGGTFAQETSPQEKDLSAAPEPNTRAGFLGGELDVSVSDDGKVLYLVGPVSPGSYRTVATVVRAHDGLQTAYLASHGGTVIDGYLIGNLVRAKQLDTYVEHLCASSCTQIFASGKERIMGPHARLGFHQSWSIHPDGRIDKSARYETSGSAQRRLADKQSVLFSPDGDGTLIIALRKADVSDEFIRKILETPPIELWEPEVDEMIEAGLLSRMATSSEFAAPPNAAITLGDVEAKLADSLLWADIRSSEPARFEEASKIIWRSVNAGESWDSAYQQQRLLVINELVPKIGLAPDALLERFTQLFAEIGRYQAQRGFAICEERDPFSAFELNAREREFQLREDRLFVDLINTEEYESPLDQDKAGRWLRKNFPRVAATGLIDNSAERTPFARCQTGWEIYIAAAQIKQKHRLRLVRAILSRVELD